MAFLVPAALAAREDEVTMLEVVLSVYSVWATAGCVVMWLDARMFRNAHATVHAALEKANAAMGNLRRRESGRTK
jgi:hypothetical protein